MNSEAPSGIVMFFFMFAHVSIVKICFHVCFANIMFLFLNHIILSCSLFGS
jgi:hypothetical protein